MTETLHVPLNKLVHWDGNVRKTGVSDGIEELAASIEAHGLLQAPIVRKAKRGKYAVVARQRRLLALQLLASQGAIAGDTEVPCQLVSEEADAGKISLAQMSCAWRCIRPISSKRSAILSIAVTMWQW